MEDEGLSSRYYGEFPGEREGSQAGWRDTEGGREAEGKAESLSLPHKHSFIPVRVHAEGF